MEKEKTLTLILDQSVLDKYNDYYFSIHPKAKKKPIEKPRHPSINQWFILPRVQMNALKQKWKDAMIWWINDLGYQDMHLEDFDLEVIVYFDTKRRVDTDNQIPKFILDGWSESGFIIDDDGKHLHSLTLKTGYDKDNPRTEFIITYR